MFRLTAKPQLMLLLLLLLLLYRCNSHLYSIYAAATCAYHTTRHEL